MPTANKPTVAIVGASTDRTKYGNKSVRAHMRSGYEVFPINPKGGVVEGLPAYVSIADVPGTAAQSGEHVRGARDRNKAAGRYRREGMR